MRKSYQLTCFVPKKKQIDWQANKKLLLRLIDFQQIFWVKYVHFVINL